MSRGPTRRRFLEWTAASAAASSLPACIEKALSIPADVCTATVADVRHVVVLIQENRSFDHYFGSFPGVRGFGDRFAPPIAGGRTVFEPQGAAGPVPPFHLDARVGNAMRSEGTPHSFYDAHFAWDEGRMGRWPAFKTERSMGFLDDAELPFQRALAEAFTLCDAYHCSAHAGTNPNRLYAFTGTNDPLGRFGGPAIDNSHERLGPSEEGYRWSTYAERLEAAGVSWKVYQDLDDNFGDNPLVGFRTFRSAVERGAPDPLVDKGVSSTLTGASLEGLRRDVLDGTLPRVAWVVAPAAYCEHPDPSSPVQGAHYVQEVLEALLADPAVFGRTVLLVTFDENDGYFDHVPPPCAPSRAEDGSLAGRSTVDDGEERYRDGEVALFGGSPYGPGPRVPMWVVSPWSRGGVVCSETFDHTSILQFLEHTTGVPCPEISAYRRAFCGDLCSAFDFATPNDAPPEGLPVVTRADADSFARTQEAMPSLSPANALRGPFQPRGVRPSRALPYAFGVATHVAAAGVQLRVHNTGRAGVVLHAYDELDLEQVPRRFAVGAGHRVDELAVHAHDGRVALFLLGPNGYHRAVRGPVDLAVHVTLLEEADASRVRLRIENASAMAVTARIDDPAYQRVLPHDVRLEPGAGFERVVDVASTGRWYDLRVALAESPGFERRFAGRLENGEDSVSDPAFVR